MRSEAGILVRCLALVVLATLGFSAQAAVGPLDPAAGKARKACKGGPGQRAAATRQCRGPKVKARLRGATVQSSPRDVVSVAGDPGGTLRILLRRAAPRPRVGHPFVIPVSGVVPAGVLGIVTSIGRERRGRALVRTRPASLDEAYSRLRIELEGTTLGELESQGASASAARSFTCTGSGPAAKFDVNSDFSKLKPQFSLDIGRPEIFFLLSGTARFDIDLLSKAKASCKYTGSAKFTIPVPGTPVVITIKPAINGSLSGEVGAGFSWAPRMAVGVQKGPSVDQSFHSFNKGTVSGPSFHGSAQAKAFLGVSLGVSVAERVGVEGNAGPQVSAGVKTSGNSVCLDAEASLHADLSAYADVFVKRWSFAIAKGDFGHLQLLHACRDGGGGQGKGGGGEPAGGDSGTPREHEETGGGGEGTGPLTWSSPIAIDHRRPYVYSDPLTAASCPSPALCVVATGTGSILTSTNPTAGVEAWSQVKIPSRTNDEMRSISCPTASLCVVAGARGVATSTDPQGEDWTPAEGSARPDAVSCPSASLCVGVEQPSRIVTSTNHAAGGSTWSSFAVAGVSQLTAISCASASLCVATDSTGSVLVSTDPLAGAGAWHPAKVDGENRLTSVACPQASLCVAADHAGNAVSTSNPTGGAAAWDVTHLTSSVVSSFRQPVVSCASASFCVFAGDRPGAAFTSTDPSSGNWNSYSEASLGDLSGLSCPTAGFCLGINFSGDAMTSTNPASSGSWTTAPQLWGASAMRSISCPSSSFCVAANDAGDLVWSTQPTGDASDWTIIGELDPPGALQSFVDVACPSSSMCVAVTRRGNLYSSTNPTGGAAAWNGVDIGQNFSAVVCPTVSICFASDLSGHVLSSVDPTGGVDAWTVTVADPGFALADISCPSQAFCVAADYQGRVLSSHNPLDLAPDWNLIRTPKSGDLSGLRAISCPSSDTCVGVGGFGRIVTSTDAGEAAPTWSVGSPGGVHSDLTSVSCASPTLCVAGSLEGEILTSIDPANGIASWTAQWIDDTPINGLTAVDCPSDSLCFATDFFGNVLYGAA